MTSAALLQIILAFLGLAATGFTWWIKRNDAKQKEKDNLHADWKAAVDSGDPGRISDMLTRLRAFKP